MLYGPWVKGFVEAQCTIMSHQENWLYFIRGYSSDWDYYPCINS